MSGPKRNADKLNTIGVVVVGICGAVMVYVTIVALQAFYMNDTSEIQTMADYGGQDVTAKSHKAGEMENITKSASNGAAPGTPQTYRVPIDHAMEQIAKDMADETTRKPFHLVPGLDRGGDEKDWITATKPTIPAFFGRPQPAAPAPTPAPAAPAPTDGAGSAAPATGSATPAPPGGHAP